MLISLEEENGGGGIKTIKEVWDECGVREIKGGAVNKRSVDLVTGRQQGGGGLTFLVFPGDGGLRAAHCQAVEVHILAFVHRHVF